MGVVVKQHKDSDGHKSKSRAIAFSSLLDKFGVNTKDVVFFRNSSDISCSQIQSFMQFT